MTRHARSMAGLFAGVLMMAAAPAIAAGPQESAGGQQGRSAPAQQGPLVLQPISSGFVFTPEVRFTEVNGSYGTMFGGSAGWLYDESLYIGGAFYGLVGGANDAQLMYGGLVTGWSAPVGRNIRVGVRALFGWGHSEILEEWTDPGYCHRGVCYDAATRKAWVYQDFMVFEPQAVATFRLGQMIALEVGGGYRLTGNNYYGWDSHANGLFGSVGIRMGVF